MPLPLPGVIFPNLGTPAAQKIGIPRMHFVPSLGLKRLKNE